MQNKSPHEQITEIMTLYPSLNQHLLAKGCDMDYLKFNRCLNWNRKSFTFNQSHVDKLHVFMDILNLKRKEI